MYVPNISRWDIYRNVLVRSLLFWTLPLILKMTPPLSSWQPIPVLPQQPSSLLPPSSSGQWETGFSVRLTNKKSTLKISPPGCPCVFVPDGLVIRNTSDLWMCPLIARVWFSLMMQKNMSLRTNDWQVNGWLNEGMINEWMNKRMTNEWVNECATAIFST